MSFMLTLSYFSDKFLRPALEFYLQAASFVFTL
jgi:hypothetical protein